MATTKPLANTPAAPTSGKPSAAGSAAAPAPADRPTRRKLPTRLRQLRWSTWRGVLWRSITGFIDDDCSDWAAALTYYAVLAIFPSAIVIVALVGLVADGQEAINTIIGIGRDLGAGAIVANDTFKGALTNLVQGQSSAKALLSFGLLGALWSASNYVGAFTRASNAIYGVEEGRPIWKLRPLQLALTAVALVLMALVAAGLVISGPVADAVGDVLHLGGTPRQLWG
ncbi:MAG TPA: YihY/virulence factor BrkB family protein, partial [Catenuloplanes sp.]